MLVFALHMQVVTVVTGNNNITGIMSTAVTDVPELLTCGYRIQL